LLDDRAVDVAFQPIVRIETGEIVSFEALARGPEGTVLASPAALFAEANRLGRTAELDWVCQAAALRTFLSAQLPDSIALFNNMEPSAVGAPCPADLVAVFADADYRQRHVVRELTERSIVDNPAALLHAVEHARQQSVGIALDDVGVNPASLAMMPLIRPDVIRLDLSLIQQQTTPAVARVANAVLAEAERTGAAILAEGIESEQPGRLAESLPALETGQQDGRLARREHLVFQVHAHGFDVTLRHAVHTSVLGRLERSADVVGDGPQPLDRVLRRRHPGGQRTGASVTPTLTELGPQ
jgi:EAL domain-containing protein (putative c-di-GMP-specific phosphodiesterase class I)